MILYLKDRKKELCKKKNPVFPFWAVLLYHSHRALLLCHFWDFWSLDVCWFPPNRTILHYTNWVSCSFNSILILSTWREYQIPQVTGSVPQDWPPPCFQMLITSSGSPVYLQFWSDLATNQWFPWPSLRFGYFARAASGTQGDMFIGLLKDMIEDIDKEIRSSSSGRVLQARASFPV